MSIIVVPRQLDWRITDQFSRTLTFRNDGPDTLWLEVPASTSGPTSNGAFYWGAISRTSLSPGNSRVMQIYPPSWSSTSPPSTTTALVNFLITNVSGHIVQQGSVPCRNDARSEVNFGDLRISSLVYNPPGPDINPEGEFIELLNVSGRELNLAGCRITQRQFSSPSSSGKSEAKKFPLEGQGGPVDFGKNPRLLPGQTVRIMTRKKVSSDPVDDPHRFYIGSPRPIWNNSGDRAEVENAEGDMVASFGYKSQAGDPNYNGPSSPATETRPQLVFQQTVHVIATDTSIPVVELEDGDILDITTNDESIGVAFLADQGILPGTIGNAPFSPEYTPSGRGLLILPRRLGPTEDAPDNDNWPLPGAPKYSLIGSLGTSVFAIGAGLSGFQVTLTSPATLELAVNDNVLWDNRGFFMVTVSVFRN